MTAATLTPQEQTALADLKKYFAAPLYHPAAGLRAAAALLPQNLQEDCYWLPFALIYANVPSLKTLFSKYVNTAAEFIDPYIEMELGQLSSSQYFLAHLGLHLFSHAYDLPSQGLSNFRLLDEYHLELALHAIRLHVVSTGVANK